MKKTILSALFLLSLITFSTTIANAEQKIVTIDVQKIINSSVQVQELNKEQEAKIQELEKWVETVKQDVEKQKTKEEKEKLFNKYQAAYIEKKAEIIKSGQTKMQDFMNQVSSAIESEAKAKGYSMVITKSIVVYGGDDITEDIIKAVAPKTDSNDKKQTKSKKWNLFRK